VTFIAPNLCGSYVFKYFHNRSYTKQGQSDSFTVGPVFSLVSTLSTTSEVKIKVDQISGEECPNLWVAIYSHGETNPKSFLTYEWAKSGEEKTFQIPKAGSWNFKAFPYKTYDHSAELSVTVKGSDSLILKIDKETNKAIVEYSVTTVDPAKDSVWIGIFLVSQTNSRYYRRYKYIADHEGSFDVKAMQTTGTYEARLCACGTYDVLATSNHVVVA